MNVVSSNKVSQAIKPLGQVGQPISMTGTQKQDEAGLGDLATQQEEESAKVEDDTFQRKNFDLTEALREAPRFSWLEGGTDLQEDQFEEQKKQYAGLVFNRNKSESDKKPKGRHFF